MDATPKASPTLRQYSAHSGASSLDTPPEFVPETDTVRSIIADHECARPAMVRVAQCMPRFTLTSAATPTPSQATSQRAGTTLLHDANSLRAPAAAPHLGSAARQLGAEKLAKF